MKKISTTIILIVSLLFVNYSFGQNKNDEKHVVPKEVLLTTLNSVNSMKKLSNETVLKLIEYNSGYVDKVYEILESDKSDGKKKDAFKQLSEDNEKSLIELFGKKGTYKDYVKLMENELEPLIKKNNHLKYLY
jgi:hypothetical protein